MHMLGWNKTLIVRRKFPMGKVSCEQRSDEGTRNWTEVTVKQPEQAHVREQYG